MRGGRVRAEGRSRRDVAHRRARRSRRRHCLPELGAPVATPAPPSAEARAAATRDFSMCREMQKEGNATACWKVWLKKHRADGSEAEIAYAEEHQGETASPTPTPPKVDSPAPTADKPAQPAAATATRDDDRKPPRAPRG